MKPTIQISGQTRHGESRRSLNYISTKPATDWSFQASAPEMRGGSPAFRESGKASFHHLSDAFFAEESKRDSRLEAAGFVVMIAMAAWPIGLAVRAAIALMS